MKKQWAPSLSGSRTREVDMVDRGPISNRARRGKNAPIAVFAVFLIFGIALAAAMSWPVLGGARNGVWPPAADLPALVPLAFVLVGLFGLVHSVRKARSPARGERDPVELPGGSFSGPVVWRPVWSPWGRVIATLVFAVFWNGIVSVFVSMAVTHLDQGFYQL